MTNSTVPKNAVSKSSLASLDDWLGIHESPINTVDAIGILETLGWTAAIVALDQMSKAAELIVLQAEWNDMLGSVIKIAGSTSHVQSALEVGLQTANQMHPKSDPASASKSMVRLINRPDEQALRAILSPDEYNVLIEQSVVKRPRVIVHDSTSSCPSSENSNMASISQALGFIETQGFTAVFEAIDTACKAAAVEVVGKEKLGGGYVTVVIRGDVAAVNAAIEAAKPRVEGLGKLIACHVIARPSEAALGLLPK
jgi:carbon dioxide concentrating mechanism protein CcmO